MCSLRGWWIFEVSSSGADSSAAETVYSSAAEDEEETELSSHGGEEDDDRDDYRDAGQSERDRREGRRDVLGGGLGGLYRKKTGERTRRGRTRKFSSHRDQAGRRAGFNNEPQDVPAGGAGEEWDERRTVSRENSQQWGGVRSCVSVRLLFSRRYATVEDRWRKIAGPAYVPLPSDKVLRHAFISQLLNEPEDDTWAPGADPTFSSALRTHLSGSPSVLPPASFSLGPSGNAFGGSVPETADVSLYETMGAEDEGLLCEGKNPSFYYDLCQERYFQEPTWPCGPTAMLVLPPTPATPSTSASSLACHCEICHGDGECPAPRSRALDGRHSERMISRDGRGAPPVLSGASSRSYPEQVRSVHPVSSFCPTPSRLSASSECPYTSPTIGSGSDGCPCQHCSRPPASTGLFVSSGREAKYLESQERRASQHLYISDDQSKGLCSLQVPSSSFSYPSFPRTPDDTTPPLSSTGRSYPSALPGAAHARSSSTLCSSSCASPPPLNSPFFSILWPVVFVRKSPTGCSPSSPSSASSSPSVALTGCVAPATSRLPSQGTSSLVGLAGRGGGGGGETGGSRGPTRKTRKKLSPDASPPGSLFQMGRRKKGEGDRFLVALAALALDEAPGLECLHPAAANCFDLPQVTAAFHVLDQLMDLYISLSLSLPSSVPSSSSPLLTRRSRPHTSSKSPSSPRRPRPASSAKSAFVSTATPTTTKTSMKTARYGEVPPSVTPSTSSSSLPPPPPPAAQPHPLNSHQPAAAPAVPAPTPLHTPGSTCSSSSGTGTSLTASQRSTAASGLSGRGGCLKPSVPTGGCSDDVYDEKDGGNEANADSSSASLSLLLALQLALPFGRPKLTSPALLRDAFESLSALPSSYSFLPPATGVFAATTAVSSEEDDGGMAGTGLLGSGESATLQALRHPNRDEAEEEEEEEEEGEARFAGRGGVGTREKISRSRSGSTGSSRDEGSRSFGEVGCAARDRSRASRGDRVGGGRRRRRRKYEGRRRRREGGREDDEEGLTYTSRSLPNQGRYFIPPRPTWTKGSVQELSELRERKLRQTALRKVDKHHSLLLPTHYLLVSFRYCTHRKTTGGRPPSDPSLDRMRERSRRYAFDFASDVSSEGLEGHAADPPPWRVETKRKKREK